jgi:hypothetical protein
MAIEISSADQQRAVQHEKHNDPEPRTRDIDSTSGVSGGGSIPGITGKESAEVDVTGSPGKKRGFWRTVQSYVWDDPDKPDYEKKFLLKLDFYLLTYTCLGYFVSKSRELLPLLTRFGIMHCSKEAKVFETDPGN